MPDTVVTPHQDTPAQSKQAAEAKALEGQRVPAGETQVALEGIGDGSPQDPARGQQPQIKTPEPPPSAERAPPKIDTRGNRTRNDIVSRFRTERAAEKEVGEQDEMSDFTQEGLPPEFVQPAPAPEAEPQAEAESQPQPEAQPQAQPQTLRLKVNGKELDLPIEEVIAKAQIAIASDNLLDKAKNKLAEIDNLAEQVRLKAQQPSPDGHHAAPNGQQTEPPLQPTDAQNRGDGKKLIEAIQFGDPDDAERLLQEEISRRAQEQVPKVVQEQLLQQRLRDEGARAAAQLKEFAEKHKDIAEDPAACAVMEVNTLLLQREDLRKLGLDPDHLRTDGIPTTPGDIAEAHRFYRANGYAVRSPAQLLEDSLAKYQEWRGVKKQQTDEAAPQPQVAAPRVELSIARQERRQAVQPQPSRTAQPRQAPQPEQSSDRSSIVAKMKAQRALKRGTVLGA